MTNLARMTAAALLLMAGPVAAQQGGEGAEAFVREVYATYAEGGDGAFSEAALNRFWRPETVALIRRDRELATDDPPYLDADPLCQCQDWESLQVVEVRISQFPRTIGPIRRADVQVLNGGERLHVVLRLRGVPGRWRIEDVVSDGRSLAADLADSNRRIESGRRD